MTAQEYLKKYFGYTTFRPFQEEIINHLLSHQDALVLMPTGGGKSLCYQLPALMMEGVAVVVSPLISLMKDQVDQLRANGVSAASLNSANTEEERLWMRRELMSGRLKLLYVSPERLLTDLPNLSRDMKISLFAIDEAHCISQWGHDFRQEYTQMGVLKQTFPNVPVVALTATADKVTRDDILRQMCIPHARVFQSSFDRPNLSLAVRRGYDSRQRQRAVLDFVTRHSNDCGIIYCLSRKNTETVAHMLEQHHIPVAVYHAGLTAEERERAQQAFVNDRVQVVCATVAFGMGINKSNVRYVIHYNLPRSIENYYQEIGRAGRDGLPSDTMLFFNLQDVIQLRHFAEESGQKSINMERLDRMVEYAQSQVCRRRTLLNYFGESSASDCGNCDVCRNPPVRFDGSQLVQMLLSAVVRTGQKATMRQVCDILCGTYSPELKAKGWDLLPTFAVGRNIPLRDWKDYIAQMLQMGYVEIAYDEHNHLRPMSLGIEVLYGRAQAMMVRPQSEEQAPSVRRSRAGKAVETPLVSGKTSLADGVEDKALFNHLRELRLRLANEQGFPPYVVMSDKSLHQLATDRPQSEEAFGQISGIGEFKRKRYGKVFTDSIREFLKNR